MRIFETITVECYAGYKESEAPRKFIFKGNEVEVKEVIERWYEGGVESTSSLSENFKVRINKQGEIILRHILISDTWEILLGKESVL